MTGTLEDLAHTHIPQVLTRTNVMTLPRPKLTYSSSCSRSRSRVTGISTSTDNTINIWGPLDLQWSGDDDGTTATTEISATSLSSTFTSSFHNPTHDQQLPGSSSRSPSALSRIGTSIQDTWRTLTARNIGKNGTAAMIGAIRRDEVGEDEEEQPSILETLKNTYLYNPSGDMHDTIMQTYFEPGSRYFPASSLSSSPQQMHIINLAAYFSPHDALAQAARPRLGDAVATILSHANKACLQAFLDPRVTEFAYRRELDRSKAGLILVVRRQGNKVVAGAYRNVGFALLWVVYVESWVGVTGLWYDGYAAVGPGHTVIKNGVVAWDDFVPDVQTGVVATAGVSRAEPGEDAPRKLSLASPMKKGVLNENDRSPTDPKLMLYQSRMFARYLLWDIWVRFDGLCECRATWEADGVVKDVRLQRALLGFGNDDED